VTSERPPNRPATLSRRSLLSWLGNAAVLAITPELLNACGGGGESGGARGTGGRGNAGDAGGPPEANPGESDAGAPGTGPFPFQPSPVDGAIYDNWYGNTVDPQNLEDILASWKLAVDGLVEQVLTLSFADILGLGRQDQVTDFHCVEGWSVLDVPWNGFHIDRLIERARPTSEATHVSFYSVGDVYTESLPLSVAREPHTLLAYGIDAKTLPFTHGFPLRLVVPRMMGYKNAKWLKRIEFTNAAVSGYWEQRGYSDDAPVPESRLREGKY
jgi:DMSO/TMAO reductase YedYZ molybdopterin-dependent catalytic subunit